MPKDYETEFWRVRIPDGWSAREDTKAGFVIKKSGGVGALFVLTDNDDPSHWVVDDLDERFHGQLYGTTREVMLENFDGSGIDVLYRFWTLQCGNVRLSVFYAGKFSACEVERAEVDEIILGFLPKSL
jgi:hypothetical protein